jgi:hypothetical protein
MLLYAPACRQEDFTNAIGYLVRRMDENSGPDNFLRYAFHIEVDSPAWQMLEQQFVDAFRAVETVSSESRRTQDRRQGGRDSFATGGLAGTSMSPVAKRVPISSRSRNEPDTIGRCAERALGRTIDEAAEALRCGRRRCAGDRWRGDAGGRAKRESPIHRAGSVVAIIGRRLSRY